MYKEQGEKTGGWPGSLPHTPLSVSFDSLNAPDTRARGGRVIFYPGFADGDIEVWLAGAQCQSARGDQG